MRAEPIKVLRQIVNSIEQRYTDGLIRIYNHTAGSDSTKVDLKLTQQRVQTAHRWLLQNSLISERQITIHPLGITQPMKSVQVRDVSPDKRNVDIVAIHMH